jgi:hypothetical protein
MSPRDDERALELGLATEQHQAAMRRGRVRPGIAQRAEAGATLVDLVENVEQVPRRARQAIEASDHQHVARFDTCVVKAVAARCAGARSASLDAAKAISDLAATKSQLLIR